MRKMLSIAVLAGLCMGISMVYVDASEDMETLQQTLKQMMPGLAVIEVAPTQIEGIMMLRLRSEGKLNILYATDDGRYLIQGSIIDMQDKGGKPADIAYAVQRRDIIEKKEYRKQLLSKLDSKRLIDFPGSKARYDVVVLTDVNCGYCRKLHSQIEEYNAQGIRIRYLLTPVLGKKSVELAASVWCSDDKARALDRAKKSLPIDKKECTTPIQQNLVLANKLGMNGTPGLVLADGTYIGGYIPPKKLLEALTRK